MRHLMRWSRACASETKDSSRSTQNLTGPAEDHARHHGGDLVAVDVELHAEAAADVRRDDADQMLGDAQVLAEDMLHLERRLMRVRDGERAVARIEIGDQAARFQGHRHLPLEAKLLLDDEIGFGERLGRLALLDGEVEGDIVAERSVDDRRAGRDGLELVADRRQRLPFDGDKLGGILGLRAAVGRNQRDGLALPDRAVARRADDCGAERWPGRCSATPTNGSQRGLMSAAVSTAATPGRVLRGLDIDGDDLGMRMRAAHEAGVQHARQLDVVDVAAVAAEQALELAARDARADAGGRRWRRDAISARPFGSSPLRPRR